MNSILKIMFSQKLMFIFTQKYTRLVFPKQGKGGPYKTVFLSPDQHHYLFIRTSYEELFFPNQKYPLLMVSQWQPWVRCGETSGVD